MVRFYQHHIGDFNNATRHLTRVERSIYSDLLDLYYDSEKPLTSDFEMLARRCMVSDDERASLRSVLNEYFTLDADGYHNERCDKEIAAYQRMSEGGKRGAANRWGKGSNGVAMGGLSAPHANPNANHEPLTINHEPVTKKTPRKSASPSIPDGVSESLWNDFLSIRKAKRSPLTATALAGIEREAGRANLTLAEAISACCEFGWQSFSAQWYADRQKKVAVGKTDALMDRNIQAVNRFLESQS